MKLKCFKKLANFILMSVRRKPLLRFLSSEEKAQALDLIVVAFNNPQLIAYQLNNIRRFIKNSDYNYLVCDNSANGEKAEEIYEFCRRENVSYWRLPRFLYEDPSRSHGYALNWIYRYIISKRKNNFMLLDHDIFPVKPVDLNAYAKEYKLAGAVSRRNKLWYMWPGFSYYNYAFLSSHKVNFLPEKVKKTNLDTGGGNYLLVYRHMPENSVHEVSREAVDFATGRKAVGDMPVQNVIEYFDEEKWLHIVGGSGWFGDSRKNKDVFVFLDKLYAENGADRL